MNLRQASIVGLIIAVLAIVTLVFRESLFASGWGAILIQLLAAMLFLWARLTCGWRSFHATASPTEGGLVTSGPYRFLRHPIYSALLYFVWAGVFTHISAVNILLGSLVTIGLVIRMLAEERLVAERYPEYAEYSSHTRRVIPYIL